MEMEVPSFLTLEPNNGFDLSAMKNILQLWQVDLSDQVLSTQGAACSTRSNALQNDVIRQVDNFGESLWRWSRVSVLLCEIYKALYRPQIVTSREKRENVVT
jgi:hypothetical protein